MATINKITEIIAAIKTVYPYYAKDSDLPTLVKTWEALLREYPDNEVSVALFKCLQICKNPPTPADFIEQLESMHKALESTDEELWDVYVTALKDAERQIFRFGYTFVERCGKTQGQLAREKVEAIWEGLPVKIRQYIGSYGEFIRMAQKHHDDELKYEKSRFMKQMPVIHKRTEHAKLYALSEGNGIAFGLIAATEGD